MKKIIIACMAYIFTLNIAAQNLVPNPSFEEMYSCPTAENQIANAIGWLSIGGSADYYKDCVTSSADYSVPFNLFGYQNASSGNSYAGFYAKAGASGYREIIGRYLGFNMVTGTKYYVSFKVSLSIYPYSGNYCGCNKFGVLFSNDEYSYSQYENFAHVYSSNVITDTLNWILIQGVFVADSNYSFINIGNFFDEFSTDTVQLSGVECNAYYFLDDICVSTDSIYCSDFIYTVQKQINAEQISVYPNPAKDFINVELPSASALYDVSICDEVGRTIFESKDVANNINHIKIDYVNSNFLIVRITCNGEAFIRKIIKL